MYLAHLVYNQELSLSDPSNLFYYKDVKRIKRYKVKIRARLVYRIEIFYYESFAFIKFNSDKMNSNSNKYTFVGMGLKVGEIKKILATCSYLVREELAKSDAFNFAFIGQPYEKDDLKNRIISKRYSLYFKQVATDFYNPDFIHFSIEELNFYTISKKDSTTFKRDIQDLLDYLKTNESIAKDCMTKATQKLFETEF